MVQSQNQERDSVGLLAVSVAFLGIHCFGAVLEVAVFCFFCCYPPVIYSCGVVQGTLHLVSCAAAAAEDGAAAAGGGAAGVGAGDAAAAGGASASVWVGCSHKPPPQNRPYHRPGLAWHGQQGGLVRPECPDPPG